MQQMKCISVVLDHQNKLNKINYWLLGDYIHKHAIRTYILLTEVNCVLNIYVHMLFNLI